MKLIEETFTDLNGRTLRRWTVRSAGTGQGYLPLDKLTNTHPFSVGVKTRGEAWAYLRETELGRKVSNR
jgi:hypothetical protein